MIKLKTILNKVLKETEEEDFNVIPPPGWNDEEIEFTKPYKIGKVFDEKSFETWSNRNKFDYALIMHDSSDGWGSVCLCTKEGLDGEIDCDHVVHPDELNDYLKYPYVHPPIPKSEYPDYDNEDYY